LEDRPSQPSRVWNRIPDEVRSQIVTLALEQCELSPRELAVRFAAISAASARGNLPATRSVPQQGASANPVSKLTLQLDHSVGAGQHHHSANRVVGRERMAWRIFCVLAE
jgi:hypothetical protein